MTAQHFDTDGTPKPPSDTALEEADTSAAILTYTSGTTQDGTPYYAYIAVTPSLYAEFHRKTTNRESMQLSDYGTIVAAGFDVEAPDDVARAMRETYGFDDRYEYKLVQQARRRQSEFLRSLEHARVKEALAKLRQQPSTAT